MKSKSSAAKSGKPGALKALERAAKNALELGLRTGAPVLIMDENDKIIDITRQTRRAKPNSSKVGKSRSNGKKATKS